MRQLSSDMLQALFAGETGEAILGLVTIEEDSLSEPIRVTSDGVSTFSADQDSTTAADKTANGNDGTLVNGPTWTSDGPNDAIRGALSFDGVDDVVDYGNHTKFEFATGESFTIEFWQWQASGSSSGSLITKGYGNPEGNGDIQPWYLSRTGRPGGNAEFLLRDSNDNDFFSQGSTDITDSWHHTAAVYDASSAELRLYVDAVLEDTVSNVNEDAYGTNAESLYSGPHVDYGDFDLSDLRIWKGVARTQQQIQDNMNTRLNGDESGLVGYWELDDTTKEFIPCPFRFSFPDQSDEGEMQARLEIDNVDRQITKAVRNATGTPTVTTQLVLASTPDTIEAEFPDFELTNVRYDKLVVEGTLTVESMTSLPFPAHTFDPSKFGNLF